VAESEGLYCKLLVFLLRKLKKGENLRTAYAFGEARRSLLDRCVKCLRPLQMREEHLGSLDDAVVVG
jgi:hypothetical protein